MIIQKENKSVQSIVDLGCGTGEITIRLAHEGYDMVGVDLSPDMLSYAQQKSALYKKSVMWIHQDIRELNGFQQIDLFISYCDVINYITKKSELTKMFKRVYNSLNDGGLFLFDIHSLYYATSQLINHTFTDENET